jgi:hypothetical protein
MQKRTLINNWSRNEKDSFLATPGGKERLLRINDETVKKLYENIENIKGEIRVVESTAVSWINLTIILTIFQILPLEKTEIKSFIFTCLPSLIILVYSTAFTLIKSPSNSKPDFTITEETDVDMRLKTTEAEIDALTQINTYLHDTYDRKTFYKKFIAPSVIVNFTVSILFIIMKTFVPQFLTIPVCISIGIISIIGIFILKRKLSFSKTIRKQIPLNDGLTEKNETVEKSV